MSDRVNMQRNRKKNLATMLKTILPSLPQAVIMLVLKHYG